MKFRKKPVVIEAYCPTIENGEKLNPFAQESPLMPIWLFEALNADRGTANSIFLDEEGLWRVTTLESAKTGKGAHVIDPGDWIIQGVQGELYPCKPDIFEATYERIDP